MEDADDEGPRPDVDGDTGEASGTTPTEPHESEAGDELSGGGSVAGTLARDQPLEAEEIDLENAVFVLLGIMLVVGLLVTGISGF